MKIGKREIILDREMSDLDKFAFGFSRAIGKITDYVIVSGYVSILLGRSRASEDIDMIIPKMSFAKWKSVHDRLVKNGYYSLNAADAKIAFDLLTDGIAVRFAPEGVVIPNMEILFASGDIQRLALSTSIGVRVGKQYIRISNLELQIAYKENALGSPKDFEDAKHLRIILGNNLNSEKLKEYKKLIK
jgi:hypothetical protein